MTQNEKLQASATIWLTNHPLNLLQLDDAQSLPQFQEPDTPQCLGEDIGELIHSPDMINLHLAVLNALMNEVVLRVNVFASIMMHWILTQGNG